MQEFTVISVTYEQSRLEYFKDQKAKLKRKLAWYTRRMNKIRKNPPAHLMMELHDKASELGMKISFYDDAIKALSKNS